MSKYKNRILTSLLAMGLAVITSAASAAEQNQKFYGGAELGVSRTDYKKLHGVSKDEQGLAGRVFAGYQISENFSTELGYGRYHTNKIKDHETRAHIARVKHQAVDLLAKGTLPVGNKFGLYGEAGVAYVLAKAKVSSAFGGAKDEEKFFTPVAGFGGTYDLDNNVQLKAGFRHTHGRHDVADINYAQAGVNVFFN